jgi:hypothetical protein
MPALNPAMLLRALAVWGLMMLAESAHGVLRRLWLDPELAFALRQLAVLVGALIVFGVAWFCRRWLDLKSDAAALAVGTLWTALTVGFEWGLTAVTGDWPRFAQDYDLAHGGLMPLGLAAMLLTPWAVRRLTRTDRSVRYLR